MRLSLTQQVRSYQQSGEGLREILAEISLRVYRYPLGRFGFSEDDCGEYYLFVYPRLLRTIERFQDRGKPFEWYLNSVLCWQLKEYRRRRLSSEENWGIAAQPGFWEYGGQPAWSRGGCSGATAAFGEPKPAMLEALRRVCGPRVSRAAGRRLLFWALKHPARLVAEDIRTLAGLSGLPVSLLEQAVREVERTLLHREERLHRLYLRRNRAYARCLHFHAQLTRELDPERKEQIRCRLDKARSCLHRTLDRLSGIRLRPSNREIARALQVPKGTVDSSLYWLKHRLMAFGQERNSA